MESPAVEVRPVSDSDLPALLELNNRAVPAVNRLDAPAMERFAARSPWFRVATRGGELAAFLIALDATAEYDSLNYAWFRARYPAFAYVDRVVAAESMRRSGAGRALYEALEAWARSRNLPMLCAEVNLEPPNPGSVLFHRAFGFREAGELAHADGKIVAMFVKPLG